MVTISKQTDKRYCKNCWNELVKVYNGNLYYWSHKQTGKVECYPYDIADPQPLKCKATMQIYYTYCTPDEKDKLDLQIEKEPLIYDKYRKIVECERELGHDGMHFWAEPDRYLYW